MTDDERLNFPWRRRFRRVDSPEKAPFDADGYLSPYADWLDGAHGLETIEHLEAQSCVAILGESGLGKSQVLEELKSRAATRGDHVTTIELSTVSGWADLASRFGAALRASGDEQRPTVLMDDFEHCPVGADFEKHLAAALEGVDRKPRLRMAIRAGAWTPALEQRLRQLFGGETVGVYELCPLTRQQVVETFEGLPLGAYEVVARLEAGGAAPLLALPVTLLMLRADVTASGVPAAVDRGEVYRRAMRRMVDWKQEVRRGQLDPDARLAIARRLAALSVFCNKRTFRTDLGDPDLPTVGALAELATDHGEPVHGDRRLASIRVEDLVEVLRESGLFVRVGPNEVSWRHASFADFLAAEYLQRHDVNGARLRSLLAMAPGSEGPPIALEGVAGWVAVLDDAVWTELARRRPGAVLRANAPALSEEKRAVLCDALFEAVSDARIGWFSAEGLTRRLRALAHPALGDQIRARLAGALSERALAEILAVAVACRDVALAPDLAHVALDVSRPLDVRTRAAAAVRLTDHAQAQLALRPLLLDDDRDASDDLLGHALFTLWPQRLSAREMFASLRQPRRSNRQGEYERFLMRLESDLGRDSLPEALEWARVRPARGQLAWDSQIVDAIARLAIEQPDPAPSLPAVLDIFERRATEDEPLIRAKGRSGPIEAFPTGLRREMLRQVASRTESRLLRNVAWTEPTLLAVMEDVGWLVDELSLDLEHDGFVILLGTALRSHHRLDDEVSERLGRLAVRSSAVRDLVVRVRADHEHTAARGLAEAAQRAGRPTLAERRAAQEQEVRQRATAFIAGDEPAAAFLAAHLGTPERANVACAVLPVEQHEPLATAAVRWLAAWPAGSIARSREAVVWALLITLQRGATAELPQSFWCRFVGTVEWPFPYLLRGVDLSRVRDAVLEHARAELRAVITGASERTAQRILHELEALFDTQWPPDVADAVATAIATTETKTALLLLHDLFESAPAVAESVCAPLLVRGDEETQVAVRALLLRFASRAARESLWTEVFTPANRRGRAVTKYLAHVELPVQVLTANFDPSEIARLNLWLVVEHRDDLSESADTSALDLDDFEYDADEAAEAARRGRAELRSLHAVVREALVTSTKEGVVAAIESVLVEQRDDEILRNRLHEARLRETSASWSPLTSTALFRLVERDDRRVVTSDADLLSAIVESLDRLDVVLQGETPLAANLWNDDGTPRHEERLSDCIKHHLDDLRVRGVIVNREVEVVSRPRGSGERIDVAANAIAPGRDARRLSVHIEVKRCANASWDDIAGELVERYQSRQVTHGVYVVGHYGGDCTHCRTKTIDEMRRHLEDVAAGLSSWVIRTLVLDCHWVQRAGGSPRRKRPKPAA